MRPFATPSNGSSRRRSALRAAAVAMLAFVSLAAAGDSWLRRAPAVMECVATDVAEATTLPGGPEHVMTDWFATHSARGLNATAAASDSFLAVNFAFNRGTTGAPDTARIVAGQSILFKWSIGIHTVTNGTGALDPAAGTLFDQPLTTAFRTFTYQFNTAGVYDFFCRNHELQLMRGVVLVSPNTNAVGPAVASGEGFARPPYPNPARGATTFRLALARPGHVRLTILDAQGRRVATVVDGERSAGAFDVSWNARALDGRTAPAGLYLARLELPGLTQTRTLALVR